MNKSISALNETFKITGLCLVCLLALLPGLNAQTLATLEIEPARGSAGADVHVRFNLDQVTFLPDSMISLFEVSNGKKISVDYQVENRGNRNIYWMMNQSGVNTQKRIFELVQGAPAKPQTNMNAVANNGAITISSGGKNFLQYNYKTMYPPKGVDTAYKRSGFIHPLWSPHGQELTRINAPDHYHHFGLWNPWTHVSFEGDTVDFWNLKSRLGTVRFAGLVSVNKGPVYADFQTRHEHVVFKKDRTEKVAINELQTVRIYQPEENSDYYIADITIQLNCASESPVVLEEYRYGGLGWRATEKWNKDNSETLTSGGLNRKAADGSKARWVIVQGSIDQDYAGAVMMSYPANYNHPEPLRIWPESMNGRGDVYANFSPTKDKDWPLLPGKDYVLKYRFLVFNGKYSKEKAEAAWQSFAHAPVITIKQNDPKTK
ncbi:MAG: PmoA family protein [Daejeonella sp.]